MLKTKQYRVVKSGDNPDLGNFVRYYLHQNKVDMKTISDGLEVNYTTFNRYLKNTSFQFTILWRISKIVNYNFLMDLGEWLEIPYETKREKELLAELSQKEDEIKILKAQLEVYQKIHKMGN